MTTPTGRYSQCDDTCTTDCGHCKGQGPPTTPIDWGRGPKPLSLHCPHCGWCFTAVIPACRVIGYECDNDDCGARWDDLGNPTRASLLLPESRRTVLR